MVAVRYDKLVTMWFVKLSKINNKIMSIQRNPTIYRKEKLNKPIKIKKYE